MRRRPPQGQRKREDAFTSMENEEEEAARDDGTSSQRARHSQAPGLSALPSERSVEVLDGWRQLHPRVLASFVD